jgi:hypothetical protein
MASRQELQVQQKRELEKKEESRSPLELESDKGEHGSGRLTSATTVSAGPPWNMLGVLYDGASEWSNGTKWHEQ